MIGFSSGAAGVLRASADEIVFVDFRIIAELNIDVANNTGQATLFSATIDQAPSDAK